MGGASLTEWLVAVEHEWLGWSLPPPARLLRRCAWRPDDPAAWCRRCGGSVGAGETVADEGCGSCRGRAVATDRVVRLGRYTPPLREWVRAIKYRGWAEMAAELGRRLGIALREHLGEEAAAAAVVVPMPMPWQRRLYRGTDHARLIAAAAAAAIGAGIEPLLAMDNAAPRVSLAARRGDRRPPPLRLRRRARWAAVAGRPLLLVDDVRTTGTTLNAAARLLRRLGPRRVDAGVLAVADDPARRPAGAEPAGGPARARGEDRPSRPA